MVFPRETNNERKEDEYFHHYTLVKGPKKTIIATLTLIVIQRQVLKDAP
jgi:hypothetical protein